MALHLEQDLQGLTRQVQALVDEVRAWHPVRAIGPQQITVIGTAPSGEQYVVVTHPVGSDTVMSVQPGGTVETRPAGTRGPYETGLLAGGDRIIFAPMGPAGEVYIYPFTAVMPNAV